MESGEGQAESCPERQFAKMCPEGISAKVSKNKCPKPNICTICKKGVLSKSLLIFQTNHPKPKFVKFAQKRLPQPIIAIIAKKDLQGLVVQPVVTISNNCQQHQFAEKVVQYFNLHLFYICKAYYPQ